MIQDYFCKFNLTGLTGWITVASFSYNDRHYRIQERKDSFHDAVTEIIIIRLHELSHIQSKSISHAVKWKKFTACCSTFCSGGSWWWCAHVHRGPPVNGHGFAIFIFHLYRWMCNELDKIVWHHFKKRKFLLFFH